METSSKILILFVVVITMYILFYLVKQRIELLKEGFTDNVTIRSAVKSRQSLPLNQCFVKASYNSAYDGSNITVAQLKSVLSQGCRFVDFNVFPSSDGFATPMVGIPTAVGNHVINADSSMLLSNLLSTISTNCFAGSVPNNADPMFIHLRINTQNNNLYTNIASALDATVTGRLYVDVDGNVQQVTGATLLSDVMGKIVVIVDRTINPNYGSSSVCATDAKNCYSLTDYVNCESGGSTLVKTLSSSYANKKTIPPTANTDGQTVAPYGGSPFTWNLVLPDSNKNYDALNIAKNFGSQICALMFYGNDVNIENYSAVFDTYKSAFVPMANVVSTA